jgi:hypothetical protein
MAASDNLLFFHSSAIVASFSDIWRLDFFGAIRKVMSLFSCICSGAEKSKEDRGRNPTQNANGQRQEKLKAQIGSPLLNKQDNGISKNTRKTKGHKECLGLRTLTLNQGISS